MKIVLSKADGLWRVKFNSETLARFDSLDAAIAWRADWCAGRMEYLDCQLLG